MIHIPKKDLEKLKVQCCKKMCQADSKPKEAGVASNIR